MTATAPAGAPPAAPRRALQLSATAALGGIALAVTEHRELAAWLTVGALLAVIHSIHRLGRAGPG